MVDNWELQVQNIVDNLRKDNSPDYKKHLGIVISVSNNFEDVHKTTKFLVKLAGHKPLVMLRSLKRSILARQIFSTCG